MSNDEPAQDVAVDRREETVITQQPGYAATVHVTQDLAADRRQILFQINRILWSLAGLLEVVLLIRFGLKMIGANPDSGFAVFIYGLTGVFTAPFTDLIPTLFNGKYIYELATAIAMISYALLFWGITAALPLVMDRPRARAMRRSTRDETFTPPSPTP
jgi:YggT family protein